MKNVASKIITLSSGFIGGIVFLVGCNEIDLNNAIANGTTEQMICKTGYYRTSVFDDGSPTTNYFIGNTSSQSSIEDLPRIIEREIDHGGAIGVSYTDEYLLNCNLVSSTEPREMRNYQELLGEGWVLTQMTDGGVILFNKYSY